MKFAGMYPRIAGKIASNGPYSSASSVFKIASLSKEESKIYKKFENEFTALTPDRGYGERISQRQGM